MGFNALLSSTIDFLTSFTLMPYQRRTQTAMLMPFMVACDGNCCDGGTDVDDDNANTFGIFSEKKLSL